MEKGAVKIMNDAVMMSTVPDEESLVTMGGYWCKYTIHTREKLTEKQVDAIMLIALSKEGLDEVQ